MSIRAEINNLKQITKSVSQSNIQKTLTEVDDLYKRIYGIRNYMRVHSPHLVSFYDALLEEANEIMCEAKEGTPVCMGSLRQSLKL